MVRQFRHDVYDCFPRAKDALFNTVDALMSETQATSLPEITQSLWFERHWSSVYEALEDGRIDQAALRKVFWHYAPLPLPEHRLWLGIDVSGIARPFSATAADRTALPVHTMPKGTKAITYGWHFSTMVVLSNQPSSRTFILDQVRVTSETTAIEVAVAQLREVAARLPAHSILVLDRGYDATWLWCQMSALPVGVLGRLKQKRRFYRPTPPSSGKRGAPRKDGALLQIGNRATYGTPDGQANRTDGKGRPVTISWWRDLHVKEARWLSLTVIQIVRPHASNTQRDPRVSWLVWLGDEQEEVAEVALGYALRFGQEHGYRFDKQGLLWAEPRLRTPEQFERWSQIVSIAHNHLFLARDLVEVQLRPWESKQRPITLQQVRSGMNKLLQQLGTPARPPKPRGKSKGRSFGAKVRKATRFPVVFKKPKVPHLVPS
ncbi:MAG: transposase [Ktedonobacteraceae bacterium]|nr:transposase [Ktedonobacteraceae bacterium]